MSNDPLANIRTWDDCGMRFDDIPEVGPTPRHPDALWLLDPDLRTDTGSVVLLCSRNTVSAHDAYRLIEAGIKIGELRAARRHAAATTTPDRPPRAAPGRSCIP